jgi:hypothetical protein
LLTTVRLPPFRSLLTLRSIRMTPRRGRAKHGLVGPVYCFARTADEMIQASLDEGIADAQ